MEAAGRVATLTLRTQQAVHRTLVDVSAVFAGLINFKASIAQTSEPRHEIFTGAIATDVRVDSALVDICSTARK